MRKLLLLLAVLPSMSYGALARVNNISGWDFSGIAPATSALFANPPAAMNVTTGNVIAGYIRWAGLAGGSIADTAGNTWTIQITGSNGGTQFAAFWATNVTGSATDTITYTCPAGGCNFAAIVIVQYSGELTSGSSFDTSASSFSGSGVTVTSGAFTTAQANEVVVCGGSYADTSVTAGTVNGAAMSINAADAPNKILAVEDIFLNSIQTGVTASMTSGSSNSWVFGCLTFKSAVTASPPTISKTFGAGFVYSGNGTSLSFTITNPNGATTLTGIGFTDTLPSGLVVATPNGLTGSCGGGTITATAASGSIALATATLTASANCTFSVNITSTSTGTKNNTTGVVASVEGGNGTAGTASLSVVSATPTLTTVRSGNWSDTSTSTSPWCTSVGTCTSNLVGHGAGGVPGYQDFAAVAAANNLTCDQTPCIAGTSAASNTAITVAAGGTLTIAAGKALTVRGSVTVGAAGGNSSLTMGAGSTLTCDTSLAPAATAYTITIGYAYQDPSLYTINGTANSRATVTSTIGSNLPCYFALGQVDALSVNWNYTDFSHMFNNSTNSMLTAWSLNGAGANDKVILLNNTFTDTGSITMSGDNIDSAAVVNIQNNNWSASKDTFVLQTNYSGSPPTGTRLISSNVFDKRLLFWYPIGYTFNDNITLDGIDVFSDADVDLPTNWNRGFHMQTTGNGIVMTGVSGNGTINTCYLYVKASTSLDAHFIQNGGSTTSNTFALANCVVEAGTSTDIAGNEGSLVTDGANVVSVTTTIITCDATGIYTSGRPVAYLGAATTRATVDHNTYCSSLSEKSGIVVGESSGGAAVEFAGMIVSSRYNSVYGGGYIAQSIATPTHVSNTMVSSNADYNNGYLLATGTCNNGGSISCPRYNAFLFSSGTPGAHDTTVNPALVNKARNLKGWDAYNGGPGTEAHALAELAKLNLATFNSLYTVTSLRSWVSIGFLPTNLSTYKHNNGQTPGFSDPSPQYWNDVR